MQRRSITAGKQRSQRNQRRRLPGSMNLNRPLQIQRQRQERLPKKAGGRYKFKDEGNGAGRQAGATNVKGRRQKRNLKPSWTRRGAVAPMTSPNVELSIFPSTACGPKNWAWLKALKASTRNWRDFASVRRTFLSRARS